jgi:pimeloyl-ACP methyl ester carboxylesterase
VVRFDERGTGLSDPVRDLPTLVEREADLAAVIEYSGLERPVLVGISEGGPIAIQLAASRADLLSGLVLYGTFAQARPRQAQTKPEGDREMSSFARLSVALGTAAVWGARAPLHMWAESMQCLSRCRSMTKRIARVLRIQAGGQAAHPAAQRDV